MFKSIIGLVKKILPTQIQNKIIAYRNNKRSYKSRVKRQTIIKNWNNQGKPLPTPHEIKQIIIEHYQKVSGCTILIETGTYVGDMVEAQRENFVKIYSIELSKEFWKRAVERFKKYKHIKIVHGDSGKVLSQITAQLTAPAIFWLDGHYSAGHTAMGDKECPILEEVDSIFKYKNLEHVLLIDDARLFTGQNDYPTVSDLTIYIQSKHPGYQLLIKDDVLIYT